MSTGTCGASVQQILPHRYNNCAMQGWAAALVLIVASCGLAADYVGSKTCASCHRKLYEAYVRTPMGRSLTPAAEHLDLAATRRVVTSEELNRRFEVWVDHGQMYQSEAGKDFRQVFPVAFAIGSGANGLSFIVRRGDHLLEAPLSYYSRSRSWGLSPGYEHVDTGFSRPISAG